MGSVWIHGELELQHVLQVYDARSELDELVIDCTGGEIQLAMSIVELLPRGVKTVALSRCMSAAVYILAAGSERRCLPSTQFLMHAGSTSIDCDSATFAEFKKHYGRIETRLNRKLPVDIRDWDAAGDKVFDGRIARRVGLVHGYV